MVSKRVRCLLAVTSVLIGGCTCQRYDVDDDSGHGWGKPKQITSLPQYEVESSPQGSYPQRQGGGAQQQQQQQNLWWMGQNAFRKPPGHPGVVVSEPKQGSGGGNPDPGNFGSFPPQRPGYNALGNGGPTTTGRPNPVAAVSPFENNPGPGGPQPVKPEARPVLPGIKDTPEPEAYETRDPLPPQTPEKTQFGGWNAQGQQPNSPTFEQSGFGHPPVDGAPAGGLAPGCELRNKADCHRNNVPTPSQNYELPQQQSYRPQGHGGGSPSENQPNYELPQQQSYRPQGHGGGSPPQNQPNYEPVPPPNQNYEPPRQEQQAYQPIATPNQGYQPPPPQPQPQQPSPQQPYSPVPPPNQGYQPPPPEPEYQPSSQQSYQPSNPYQPSPPAPQPPYQPSNAYQRPQSQPQPAKPSYQSNAQSSSQLARPQQPYSPPQNPRRPQEEAPAVPYPGCPSAMKCVQDDYCSRIGLIEPQPVQLSAADRLNRVALMSCSEPMTGIVGVCCRDPNYTDPWPDKEPKNGAHHQHHDKGHHPQGHQPLGTNHLQTGNPYSEQLNDGRATPVPLRLESKQSLHVLESCSRTELCLSLSQCHSYNRAFMETSGLANRSFEDASKSLKFKQCKYERSGNRYICCAKPVPVGTTTPQPIRLSVTSHFTPSYSTTRPQFSSTYTASSIPSTTTSSSVITGLGLRFHSALHSPQAQVQNNLKPNPYGPEEPAIELITSTTTPLPPPLPLGQLARISQNSSMNLNSSVSHEKVDISIVPSRIPPSLEFLENPPIGFIFKGDDLYLPEVPIPSQNYLLPTVDFEPRTLPPSDYDDADLSSDQTTTPPSPVPSEATTLIYSVSDAT